MATSTPREESVYIAKLAEQAERYEEMVEFMEKVSSTVVASEELTVEERNLLSVAYQNVIGARRASWRIISSIEQKEESRGNADHVSTIKDYRSKIENELSSICDGILKLLDTKLIHLYTAGIDICLVGDSASMVVHGHDTTLPISLDEMLVHWEEMAKALQLPIIDLASPDRISTANSIRQACIECGFFYLINHGVEQELLKQVFDESKRFFSLPLEEKMKLLHRENRGYTPLYAENLNPSSSSKGGSKESFYIGPLESISSHSNLNHWPSEEVLPSWRPTIESYYERVLTAGKKLISLIALALNLDEDFFEKVGAFNPPMPFLRLLHYPGELGLSDEEIFGASAHSDYGMITFLATDGVGGLQVCRDKSKQPLVWEDVDHINGALIVNIGDMTERWTNCLFRSTLHRVVSTGRERYSMAFFLNPSTDCVVECLESCCSELTPPRFPPVRSGDYLGERFRLTYGSQV